MKKSSKTVYVLYEYYFFDWKIIKVVTSLRRAKMWAKSKHKPSGHRVSSNARGYEEVDLEV